MKAQMFFALALLLSANSAFSLSCDPQLDEKCAQRAKIEGAEEKICPYLAAEQAEQRYAVNGQQEAYKPSHKSQGTKQ